MKFTQIALTLSVVASALASAIPNHLDNRNVTELEKQQAFEKQTVDTAVSQFSNSQQQLQAVHKQISQGALSAATLLAIIQGLSSITGGLNSALSQIQEACFCEAKWCEAGCYTRGGKCKIYYAGNNVIRGKGSFFPFKGFDQFELHGQDKVKGDLGNTMTGLSSNAQTLVDSTKKNKNLVDTQQEENQQMCCTRLLSSFFANTAQFSGRSKERTLLKSALDNFKAALA